MRGLPPALKRLAERVHAKARPAASNPRTVAFVLDALLRSALPPPPTKKRGLDDDSDDGGDAAPDVFRQRRAAAAAKKVKVEAP